MTGITGERRHTCFVIMPFGEKHDFDGATLDFDDIYRFFFKKAIEGLEDVKIDVVRCDEIAASGSISEIMFEHIYNSDVVVVDITTANPNVFYELGVRHALARGVTVLIRRKGTTIPFNIQSLQIVEYDQMKFGSIEGAKERIAQIIRNGLLQHKNDSPVLAVLDLNIWSDSKPLADTQRIVYNLKSDLKKQLSIGLITGDLQNVKGVNKVDVWVNSENTDMRMSRPFENTISGIIRYHGQTRSANGAVEDTIAQSLAAAMKGRVSVGPGEVVVTVSGALEQTHGVHWIFHAASVFGQVGKGYSPIPDVSVCVKNALDEFNKPEYAKLDSILFPLMGVRTREDTLLDRVKTLFDAAIGFLNNADERTKPQSIYFLAYTDKELDVCTDLLDNDRRLDKKTTTTPAASTADAGLSPVPPLAPVAPAGPPAPAGGQPPRSRGGRRPKSS